MATQAPPVTARPITPRAVADKAREVLAKVIPGSTHGRRSLPIRADADRIRALWDEPQTRVAVLEGIPSIETTLDVGQPVRDWGTVTTISLRLEAAVPGIAAQTLAGKAVRRLKALVETGEVPTTAFNPSCRTDAGEPAS
jgi:hypothetical protein